ERLTRGGREEPLPAALFALLSRDMSSMLVPGHLFRATMGGVAELVRGTSVPASAISPAAHSLMQSALRGQHPAALTVAAVLLALVAVALGLGGLAAAVVGSGLLATPSGPIWCH